MNVILKPVRRSGDMWRMNVIRETPRAAPIILHIPRRPTMVATFVGISSMQALFAAGNAMPAPMPESSMSVESIMAGPDRMSGAASRRTVPRATMANPRIIGLRYPLRRSMKEVTAETAIVETDRGVNIMPLIIVESP